VERRTLCRSRRTGAGRLSSVLIRTVCLLLLLAVGAAQAAPQAELWERWLAHDPRSIRPVDHSAWDDFLMRYVRIRADGVHGVAYGQVTLADRGALEAYIDALSRLPISRYGRPEQMAYWINLYNALLVRVVLEHYPVASVRDIGASANPGTGGPWDGKRLEIEGAALSLNDIEHRILRPIWRDPRIHYALSCAAIGCPNLQPEPFAADRIERQLNQAAIAYINDPRCIQTGGDQLVVSSIYRWYQDDFGGSDRAVINHLMAYAEPGLAMSLQHFERIDGDRFEWRLNDATP
jgi:hypothetical protein